MTTIPPIQSEFPQPRIRQERSFLRELIETTLLIAAIYAFVNLATARYVVDGNSMQPNFHSDQFIIVSRISYILGEPQRGDVVVFHYPRQTDRDFIKRVIGVPGDMVVILGGRVYVNDELIEEPYIERFCSGKTCDGEWVVGQDEYFLLGDNRASSQDSQDFGPVERKYIVGRAMVRYWPPSEAGLISRPSYSENGAPIPTLTPTPLPSTTPTATMIPPASGIMPPDYPTATPTPYGGWAGPNY